MVMVSARLTRRWRLSYRHDIDERGHRRPARRLVAVRRRAIFVLPEGEVDRHGLPTGAAAVLHDARATTAVGASYSGVNRSSTCKLHQTKYAPKTSPIAILRS